MIVLRPYQTDLVHRADVEFAQGAAAVVVASPTGSGKSAIAAEICRRRVLRGQRILYLAHLDALLDDTVERMRGAGIRAGLVQAGRPSDPSAPAQVASLQTLHLRDARPPADFLLLDECHRAMAATVSALLDAYPGIPLLGFTATPQRGDGQPLGDRFQRLVDGPSTRWLTEQEFLVPCDVVAPPTPDAGGLAADPVDAWHEYSPGARAIVFAKNVRHANDVTARFRDRGVAAECITGDTSRTVRRGLRGRLESGESRVLVSVGVFIEGFDAPSIESVILARPFGVCGPYLQAIGRGLRPSPATGKRRCTVVDLHGAVYVHGLPDDERRWNLAGDASVRTGDSLEPLRRCGACLAVYRPAVRCPRCGAVASTATKLPRVNSRAERLELVNTLPSHERDRRYLASLINVARGRMRLPLPAAERWAQQKFLLQFGRAPAKEAA